MAVIEGSIQSNDTNGEQTKEKKRKEKKERMNEKLLIRKEHQRTINPTKTGGKRHAPTEGTKSESC